MPTLTSTDPATGETLGEVEVADAAAVEDALERARAAQPAWSARPLRERLDVLEAFQSHLLDERREVAELVSRESGKPVTEALMADVLPALDMVRFLDREAARVLRSERVRLANLLLKDRTSALVREPAGVVGIIAPWNYPVGIPASQVATALAAGNTVVLKPSEHTPLVGARLVELFHEAGVPADVLALVQGPGEPTGAALVAAHPDHLVFTGSVPTGQLVAKECADSFTPVTLELGGKDPMLVLDDANVELAAKGAVWGAFTNAGQTCAAVERVYVHEDVAPAFVRAVVAETQRIRVGAGLADDVDMGPLIEDAAVTRVQGQVDDALKRGATLVRGGKVLEELGPRFYAPTVLTDVDHEMVVMREETFGPLLPIMVVGSDAEAVALANDTRYGLSASVWTTNAARGEALARLLDVGTVTLNDCVYTYAACETPWGGERDSGIGRTHGRWGLEELTRVKHVNRARAGRARSPWYYPYDADLRKLMDDGLEFLYRSKAAGTKVVGALKRRFF